MRSHRSNAFHEPNLTLCHDANLDKMQEDVFLEHKCFMWISTFHEYWVANLSRSSHVHHATHLAAKTPTTSPFKEGHKYTTPCQEEDVGNQGSPHDITTNQTLWDYRLTKLHATQSPILSFELATQVWLRYLIHEALAAHQDNLLKQEKHANDEILMANTPLCKVHKCGILRSTFFRVPQPLYPSELPNEVSEHHLHFTQLPRQEMVNKKTSLFGGIYVTIYFITKFKNISKGKAKGTCMERLQRMKIALGREYSNWFERRSNTITIFDTHSKTVWNSWEELGYLSWKWRMVTGTSVRLKKAWAYYHDKESSPSPQRPNSPKPTHT